MDTQDQHRIFRISSFDIARARQECEEVASMGGFADMEVLLKEMLRRRFGIDPAQVVVMGLTAQAEYLFPTAEQAQAFERRWDNFKTIQGGTIRRILKLGRMAGAL